MVGTTVLALSSFYLLRAFIEVGLFDLSSAIGTSASILELLGPPSIFVDWVVKRRNDRKEIEEKIARELPILQTQLMMGTQHGAKMFRVPPLWVDFKNHVYERNDLKELRAKVEEKPFSLLLAKSGAGKTTLALHLGYKLLTEYNWRFVFYWDVTSSRDITDSLKQASSLLSSKHLSGEKALAIIDNTHLDEHLAANLTKQHRSMFGDQLVILFIARCKRDSIEMDGERWRRIFKNNDEDDFVSLYKLEEDGFDAAIKGLLATYCRVNDLELPSEERILSILHSELGQLCKGSLMLLKFVFEALERNTVDVEKLKSVEINQAVQDHYDEVINQVLQCEDVRTVWHGMTRPIERYQLVRRCLLLIAIFSSIELYTPRDFILRILVSVAAPPLNSAELSITFINNVLSELNKQGELTASFESDELDSFSLPHLTIAKILPDAYQNDFSSGELPFQNPGWNAQWPYEQGVVALMTFVETECNELMQDELSRVMRSISPFFDDESQVWALRGYVEATKSQCYDTADAYFRLAQCCMVVGQPDDAKDAMSEALSLQHERIICALDMITNSSFISMASPNAHRIARNLFDFFNPWMDGITDVSGPLLQYDIFAWLEVEGSCPFCDTDFYIEVDIPVPDRSAESIHGSETTEDCAIECSGCQEILDFSVFNSIAHSFFILEPMPKNHTQWKFRYRERCRHQFWY